MSHIFTVHEITSAIKDVLEAEFPFAWVRGQVSNLARPASGHMYFSLKDESSLLNVVWFKSSQWVGSEGEVHPLTGEVCEGGPPALEDGQEVLVAGRISVYGPRGAYQLVAELVQTTGQGELQARFEALQRELAELGFFAQERKRPLPVTPGKVAVVTAATGAAVHDFIRVAEHRGCGADIRIFPSLVQGEAAPAQLVTALMEAQNWGQCVALVRGGGSLEDLWAFNTREVAQAVHDCAVPVVCGVGHEVDVSIADLVADVRAATPSHAAQLLWPARGELAQQVDELELKLHGVYGGQLERRGAELADFERRLAWLSPLERLARAEADLDALCVRLESAIAGELDRRAQELERFDLRLMALDPDEPLRRGYGRVRLRATGEYVRSVSQVAPGEALDIQVQDGSVAATVESTRSPTRSMEEDA